MGQEISVERSATAGSTVGRLLHDARDACGLGQRGLADISGVTQGTISRIERGCASPTIATLDRLLAACGVQMRIELEPLHADVDREIDATLALTPAERLTAAPVDVREILHLLTAPAPGPVSPLVVLAYPGRAGVTADPDWSVDLPYAVDGEAAALLHGAPVRPVRLDLAVPDDERALRRMCAALAPGYPRLRRPAVGGGSPTWGSPLITPDLLRAGPATWLTVHGRLGTRPEATNPRARAVEIVVDGAPVPVLPPHEIAGRYPDTALALDRLVQRQR